MTTTTASTFNVRDAFADAVRFQRLLTPRANRGTVYRSAWHDVIRRLEHRVAFDVLVMRDQEGAEQYRDLYIHLHDWIMHHSPYARKAAA